ncbi:MAG: heavy-metal-associated domain-containing protein [Salinarimonadaceae bacterium]|nr:MAG: heavy-metal-associated domain-containing protein [Salinarimonadaceae bacterium]
MGERREYRLSVEGMGCGGCVAAVEKIVLRVDPGAKAQVDLAAGEARIEGEAAPEAVCEALAQAGYPASPRAA